MKKEFDKKKLYKLMVEASANALLLIDKRGKLLYLNASAKKLFQYTDKEIYEKPIELLIPDKYKEKHVAHRNKFLKNTETRAMGFGRDLYAIRKDKTEFPAEVGLNPIKINEEIYVLATIIDISERKKHENEINLRNKQLAELSFKLTQLNSQLETKNRNLNESIEYARKIQLSVLPEQETLINDFHDFSIYHSPKERIGGDFYWFKCINNFKYVAVIDCTGHSVPGAMLSIVIFSLLNEVCDEIPQHNTGSFLELLHRKLYHFLQQDKGASHSQDGCDISLCKIDLEKKTIEYSGARQNLYLYDGDELKVVKATQKTIGGCSLLGIPEPERTFKTDTIELQKTTLVAMTTDGVIDQLNAANMVFSYKRFHNLLIKNWTLSGEQATNETNVTIENWKKDTEQLDDMLTLMFKV